MELADATGEFQTKSGAVWHFPGPWTTLDAQISFRERRKFPAEVTEDKFIAICKELQIPELLICPFDPDEMDHFVVLHDLRSGD